MYQFAAASAGWSVSAGHVTRNAEGRILSVRTDRKADGQTKSIRNDSASPATKT